MQGRTLARQDSNQRLVVGNSGKAWNRNKPMKYTGVIVMSIVLVVLAIPIWIYSDPGNRGSYLGAYGSAVAAVVAVMLAVWLEWTRDRAQRHERLVQAKVAAAELLPYLLSLGRSLAGQKQHWSGLRQWVESQGLRPGSTARPGFFIDDVVVERYREAIGPISQYDPEMAIDIPTLNAALTEHQESAARFNIFFRKIWRTVPPDRVEVTIKQADEATEMIAYLEAASAANDRLIVRARALLGIQVRPKRKVEWWDRP